MWNKSIWGEAYDLETIIRPNFVYINFSYLDSSLPLGCYGNLFLGFCVGSNYSFYPCLCARSNSPWSYYLMFILNSLVVVSFESLRGSAGTLSSLWVYKLFFVSSMFVILSHLLALRHVVALQLGGQDQVLVNVVGIRFSHALDILKQWFPCLSLLETIPFWCPGCGPQWTDEGLLDSASCLLLVCEVDEIPESSPLQMVSEVGCAGFWSTSLGAMEKVRNSMGVSHDGCYNWSQMHVISTVTEC